MISPANCTVKIYRGTTTNYAGDDIDSATVAATGVPAFLVERRRVSTNPADGMPRTVRYAIAKLDGRVVIRSQDRLEDQTTGTIYLVEAVSVPRGREHEADIHVDLKRAN